MATTTTAATATVSLTIGPDQMPHVVPAGATVQVVGELEGREVVYIKHGHYAGAVLACWLTTATTEGK
jgi:hypothetical protein